VTEVAVVRARTLLVSPFFRTSRPIGKGCLFATGVAVLSVLLLAVGSASATPDAPRVQEQFLEIAHHGDPLAVRRGVGKGDFGPAGRPCKHYQGLARGAAADGTPYFFFTRSRNRSNACLEITWWPDLPGELLIAKLGSRDTDGERLRSNRLAPGLIVDDTAPPSEDTGTVAIYFDGKVDDHGNFWPLYWHPGGVQLVDDVLVVPLTCSCASNALDCPPLQYECPNDAGLMLIDVSEPEKPVPLLHQTRDTKYGAVAVAKSDIVCQGNYLFAFATKDAETLDFACNDTPDLRNTQQIVFQGSTAPNPTPRHWQTVNFIRDTSGTLYLLGADNETDSLLDGKNFITLSILDESKLAPDTSADAISVVDEKRLLMKWPLKDDVADLGDLKAASGVYVSPTGQLIFYSANHGGTKAKEIDIIEMGEFRNITVSHLGTCGLQLPPDLGGPYVVDEGESMSLDFNVHYIEPWVHLFGKVGFLDRSLMLDWVDQDEDDHFKDFRKVGGCFGGIGCLGAEKGFNDTMESLKFCGPAGATLHVYADVGFKETDNKYPSIGGDYQLHSDPNVDGFKDVASSAEIVWEAPASQSIEIDWGENEAEVFSIPYGERSFSIERTYLDDEPSGTAQDEHVIMAYDAVAPPVSGKVASAVITVRNVAPAPSVDRITDETGAEIGVDVPVALMGLRIDMTGSVTDPGVLDTHTAAVDWGDGTTEDLGDVVETVSVSHAYLAAWDYTIFLRVADDDGGIGTASRQIAVVDAGDGLSWVVDLLRSLPANPKTRRAIAKLEGEAGGRPANGAMDLLGKGNLNAAMGMIKQSMQYLEAADPGLDLGRIESLLALSAKSVAINAVMQAGAAATRANVLRKVQEARDLIAEGDGLLAALDLVGAVERYERAVRVVGVAYSSAASASSSGRGLLRGR
jgi:hypothetical protein